MRKMNLQLFAKQDPPADPPEPPKPPKEDEPGWAKKLMETVTGLGERMDKLEKDKGAPPVTVPVPEPPKPPKPAADPEPPAADPEPKRKSLLDLIW
jgi:hypothetical protein